MTSNHTHMFLAEPARAVSLAVACAPVDGHGIDDAGALAGRYAS
jgi:hypothetical protein